MASAAAAGGLRPLATARALSRRWTAQLSSCAVSPWQGVDPHSPHIGETQNLLGGRWIDGTATNVVPDAMTGLPMMDVSEVTGDFLQPYVQSLLSCPKTGLHNPLKLPER